jgi:flagellin
MSLVINTNSLATTATRNLATNSANLSRSLARLSSGSKIVTPADDAGGLAVANKLKAALNRNVRTQQNVQNALSFMQVQDGALKVASSILDRMSELKTMSLDVTKNSLDIANYDAEFTQLQEQLSNVKNEDFNGIGLFNATANLTTYTTSDGDSSSEPSVTTTRTGLFQELGNITYQGTGGTKQVDTVTITGGVATDTFSVTVDGNALAAVAFNTDLATTATDLAAAINADATIGALVTADASAADGSLTLTAATAGTGFTASSAANDVSTTGAAASTDAATTANATLSVAEFTIDTQFAASSATATTFVKSTATDGSIRLGYIANDAAQVTAAGHGLDFAAAVTAGEVIEVSNVSSLYDSEAGVAKARIFETTFSTHAGGEVVFDDASNSFYIANGVTKNYSDATALAATVQTEEGEFTKLDSYLKASDYSDFNSSSSYQLGDIVSLNSNLYVASANITAGLGDPSSNATAGTGWVAISQNAQSGADLLTSTNTLSNYTTADFQSFIQTAATARAQNGAEMQRFNVSAEMLETNHTNFEAAHSRLADVDIATESTQFAKNNILVQSAAAMLSQANNLPSIALQLLQ